MSEETRVESETALEWFVGRLRDPTMCVLTGCRRLDGLLGGSIPLASVTEIAGEVGAGKYRLAMDIVAQILLSGLNYAVVVLNYNQSINEERLYKVLTLTMGDEGDSASATQLLKGVRFRRTYDKDMLEESLKELKREFSQPNSPVPFVIISSVGAMFSDTTYGEMEMGQDQVLRRMREFCWSTGGSVVALNDIVRWRGEPAAALGKSWIGGVPTRLLLCQGAIEGEFFVRVQRNESMSSTIIPYTICDGGFRWGE